MSKETPHPHRVTGVWTDPSFGRALTVRVIDTEPGGMLRVLCPPNDIEFRVPASQVEVSSP